MLDLRSAGKKHRPLKDFTREHATKVMPSECSDTPMSTLTRSRVQPCDLWIVIAKAKHSGICVREHTLSPFIHSIEQGGMGTARGTVGKNVGPR